MGFGMLGKKLGMTQVYTAENLLIPVTVFEVGPCPVVQVKNSSIDGYNSVQIGFGKRSQRRLDSPLRGHLAKASVENVLILREFTTTTPCLRPVRCCSLIVLSQVKWWILLERQRGEGFKVLFVDLTPVVSLTPTGV